MRFRSLRIGAITIAAALCVGGWWSTLSTTSHRTTQRGSTALVENTEVPTGDVASSVHQTSSAVAVAVLLGEYVDRLKAAIEQSNAEEILQALIPLTRRILCRDEAEFRALVAALDDAANAPQFRALLLLVIAQWPDERAVTILRRYALDTDEVLSLVAVKGLLFRASLRCSSDVSDDFLAALWRGAFQDRQIGKSIASGFANTEEDSPAKSPWTQVGLPDEDESTTAALMEVVQRGLAVSARTFSIRKLPPSAATDGFLRAIAESEASPTLVRAVAYEYMQKLTENWSAFAAALQRETEPRVLAGLCSRIDVSSRDTKTATIQILERLAPLAAQDSQLANRLSAALSFSESAEGLAALERMAQTGGSVDLRREAIRALTYCSYDSPMWKERMATLNRLASAQDPLTGAIAACVLMESWEKAHLRDAASQSIDESFFNRAKQLAAMDQLPGRVRVDLQRRLQRFNRK